MPNSVSRSYAHHVLTTVIIAVDIGEQRLGENTVAGSAAAAVKTTLIALHAQLSVLEVLLRKSSLPSPAPSLPLTSKHGGPGAVAPKQPHNETNPNPLTVPEFCDGLPTTTTPYEPPADWSHDSDLAFQALDDSDAQAYEDGICGP